MAETLYISKTRTLLPAENYTFLRAEGLRYIEELAHDLWTDYNEHDPGITILEALCYAITELGYRTNFDIKDLLADGKGSIGNNQAFFTPREILTNEPYTLTDYRKLLIDLKGVANAWMVPAIQTEAEKRDYKNYHQTEVPLFPECKNDRLVYKPTDHSPVDLRGLYQVRLNLDNTDSFGDLNSSNLDYTVYGSELRGAKIECILPRYNEVNFDWLAEYYNEVPESVSATPAKLDQFNKPVYWTILLVYKKSTVTTTFQYDIQPSLKLPIADFEARLEQELEQKITQQQIMELYYNKTLLIRTIVETAWETLHAHRNLCEDWWPVDVIRNTPVALCADVDVKPEMDIEKVYSAIIIAVEQYLNPPVKFYSLKELRQQNVAVEDIFEGPKLDHGFVLNDELEKAQLRKDIYVSDLINIIMDIEGVVAIKNKVLTAYDDNGKAILPSAKWCLHIDADHKPVLDIERSKLLFFKNNLPYRVKYAEAKDTILYLRGLNATFKLTGSENDIGLPLGNHYDLHNYSSIQHDLPDTYSVGKAGLPATADDEQKGKAKQLKAYLLFFDQLLAGFFSQLQGAKDLLGLDENNRQSYFQQYLDDWKKDEENGIRNIEDIYTDGGALKNILSTPMIGEPAAITDARKKLVENEATYNNRRNRFLDHLIGRFGETFNDYVLLLHASKSEIDKEELIRDKIRFIKDYPQTSSSRGTAYNILGRLWDTSNVSGLEKRIARLTGINNTTRRNLFCYPLAQIENKGSDAAPKYSFVLKDNRGRAYLEPISPLQFYDQAERLLSNVYENMLQRDRYFIKERTVGKFNIFLRDESGNIIAGCVRTYPQKDAATRFITSVLKNFHPACDEEGMYLIEHFLLRPHFHPPLMLPQQPEDVYKLLKVCLPQDCLFCGEEDPYSFRATVVLPYWPMRFRDINFRTFFETTIRREAPAHVHVKVCWINFTDMERFERAMLQWLQALQSYCKDQQPDAVQKEELRKANNEMVDVMNSLKTIYPEATLHDCEDGTTNPVRLGKTALGSF